MWVLKGGFVFFLVCFTFGGGGIFSILLVCGRLGGLWIFDTMDGILGESGRGGGRVGEW